MTSLPALDGTPETLQYVIDKLASAGIDTGGRKIHLRWGTSSVTFAAADTSAQVSIAHGMGKTPTWCAGFAQTPANARLTVQETQAADGTNIYLKGFQTQGTVITATQGIYWVAIG